MTNRCRGGFQTRPVKTKQTGRFETCPYAKYARWVWMTAFLLILHASLFTHYATAKLENGMDAEIVIGQSNFNSALINGGGASPSQNTIRLPRYVFFDGQRLFIAGRSDNRVLIFNSLPTTNNARADVVVGQANFQGGTCNQGGARAANTVCEAFGVFSTGTQMFVSDRVNSRVLIFNSIPTANNAFADVVVGQTDFTGGTANQGGTPSANTLNNPYQAITCGEKFIVADSFNERVLIFNTMPTRNNTSANVVIGQANFTSNAVNQGGSPAANTLDDPRDIHCVQNRLFIADISNSRVLIFNSIPTSNNASADVVVGQPDFNSNAQNQGGSPSRFTFDRPGGVSTDGARLFIADHFNHRILVYKTIPTTNGAPADFVIGQKDFVSNTSNQGLGSPRADTLDRVYSMQPIGSKLIAADYINNRVLIYNIGSSDEFDLGPQFSQGKAVVGKVYWDFNENGKQDWESPPTLRSGG